MRTCRAHYPGGSERVPVSIASPFHAAFPKLWVGRHPHCPFRGLLRLHSRYGPHACSTAQGGLCHGAWPGPVARPRRPIATSAIDNSLGGTFLHKCFAPSRRTRVCGHQEAHCRSSNSRADDVCTPSAGGLDVSAPQLILMEFIAWLKANPNNALMASTGTGSAVHLFGIWLQ